MFGLEHYLCAVALAGDILVPRTVAVLSRYFALEKVHDVLMYIG